jgi:hypothetical protein
MKRSKLPLGHFARNLFVIAGIILIWRGIWYVLDELDKLLFGGSHIWTALGGILLGLVVIYLPDRDLKEIEKL